MRRGELYRVQHPAGDPRRSRVFVIVSRQVLLDSRFTSVICAPVFTEGEALATQVEIGTDEGLKHPSWIVCDNLASLSKSVLTNYVGTLGPVKLKELHFALRAALDVG